MSLAVDEPILNNPFEEPREYWVYEEGHPKRMSGRRPAGYYFRTGKRTDSQVEMFVEEQFRVGYLIQRGLLFRMKIINSRHVLEVHNYQSFKTYPDEANLYLSQMNVLLVKNTNLRKTRDFLLPKLISGEIDVEKLDIAVAELQ